ncbi:MAG: hypothetical protein HC800_07930 [Phormidesmis sp. RL_2_1]|nr:hypothetical protein [Phormidesmis sp. RL_2_1]
MASLLKTRFRPDLLVTPMLSPLNGIEPIFTVKDLRSGQMFCFDEQKYFLCQLWNGQASLDDVRRAFRRQFHQSLSLHDLEAFLSNIGAAGLLEPCPALTMPKAAAIAESRFIWAMPLSAQAFRQVAALARQFCWLGSIALWGAVPGLAIVLLTLTHHIDAVRYDLTALFSIPFGQLFLLMHGTFAAISLLSHLVQGLVLSDYGGRVTQLRVSTSWGFFPLIQVASEGVETLPRQSQLWVFGSSLLVRLVIIIGSTLLWYNTRVSGTSLHLWAVVLVLASWLELVIEGSPLWPSNGYLWMVTYLRLPRAIANSQRLWIMLLQGRALPPALTFRHRLLLGGFGLLCVIASVALFGYLVVLFSHSLALLLRGLLGESARPIILGLILIFFLRYLWNLRS